jgi:hypothetical protein
MVIADDALGRPRCEYRNSEFLYKSEHLIFDTGEADPGTKQNKRTTCHSQHLKYSGDRRSRFASYCRLRLAS